MWGFVGRATSRLVVIRSTSLGMVGVAAACLVSASPAIAQISSGRSASSGGPSDTGAIRLHDPTWADFPVAPPAASKISPNGKVDASPAGDGTVRPESKDRDSFEERLQSITTRSRKTPVVKRRSRSDADAEGKDSQQAGVLGIIDLLGDRDTDGSGWRGRSQATTEGSTASSSRLRSSLWRRGARNADDEADGKQQWVTEAPESRRPLTGGIRAGAPPARPGYGAREEAKKAKTLNAGAPLPERQGIGNVVLRDQ